MKYDDLSTTGKKIIYGLCAVIITMCIYYFAVYSKPATINQTHPSGETQSVFDD